MKKILILSFIISISVATNAHSKGFVISPSYTQKYHQGDTVSATAQVFGTDGSGLISWSIVLGSASATLSAPVVTNSPTTTTSTVTILNAVAGTYILKAVGTSPTGSTAFLTDSLVVLPPIPVCPVPKTPCSNCNYIELGKRSLGH